MRKQKSRRYFVSFYHPGGFANTELSVKGKLSIAEVQKTLAKRYTLPYALILHFIEFKNDEIWDFPNTKLLENVHKMTKIG